jgi:hypothetical protein
VSEYAITRDELGDLCVMVYDAAGNAVEVFDWTPEALEDAARRLRRALGEETTITMGPSPFML